MGYKHEADIALPFDSWFQCFNGKRWDSENDGILYTVHSFCLAIADACWNYVQLVSVVSWWDEGFCLNHQTTHKNLTLFFSPGIQEHRREEQRRQQEMQVPMLSMRFWCWRCDEIPMVFVRMFVLFNYFIDLAERWFVLTIGRFFDRNSHPWNFETCRCLNEKAKRLRTKKASGIRQTMQFLLMKWRGLEEVLDGKDVCRKMFAEMFFFVCPMSSQFWFVFENKWKKRSAGNSDGCFYLLSLLLPFICCFSNENWSRHWFSKASKDEWLHPFRCEELQGDEPKSVLWEWWVDWQDISTVGSKHVNVQSV